MSKSKLTMELIQELVSLRVDAAVARAVEGGEPARVAGWDRAADELEERIERIVAPRKEGPLMRVYRAGEIPPGAQQPIWSPEGGRTRTVVDRQPAAQRGEVLLIFADGSSMPYPEVARVYAFPPPVEGVDFTLVAVDGRVAGRVWSCLHCDEEVEEWPDLKSARFSYFRHWAGHAPDNGGGK